MIHRIFGKKLGRRAGFTLIELAIVLAVTSLLTAGLWRMMSSGNTQLRDQASADQHRALSNAIREYLASTEGRNHIQTDGAVAGVLPALFTFNVPLNCGAGFAGVCNFLPTGFNAGSTNSYGQGYVVQVRRVADLATNSVASYSFMVMTTGGDPIPDTSGGRISSLIGNDGGFIYSTTVCNAPSASWSCGSYGTWQALVADYALVGVVGHVASRTFVGMTAELNAPWLARQNLNIRDSNGDGIDDFNTLETSIAVRNNEIRGIPAAGALAAQAGSRLLNFAQITGDRTFDLPGNPSLSPPVLLINTSCNKGGDVTNLACNFGASFNTDVQVSQLLMAHDLYASSFIYNIGSDMKLKHEITLIDNPLEKIAKFNGYSFIYNGGQETHYGVIAQEVEKSFPELIHKGSDGYMGVDYIGLIGPLVAAVNQLREENKELKAGLEAQGRTMEALEKKISKKK